MTDDERALQHVNEHFTRRPEQPIRPRALIGFVVVVVLFTVAAVRCSTPLPAGAQDEPKTEPASKAGGPAAGTAGALPPEAAVTLDLARACWVEASFSLPDCGAIRGAIARRAARAGWTFARMLHAYSALDAKSERAAFARQLPDGDEPSWEGVDNARWEELRTLADRVEDPCAPAVHWGGLTLPTDHERALRAVRAGKWERVRCSAPTRNSFFREIRR
jgi:hypothetical protein